MFILLVDRWHAMWNAIFDDVSVKLEKNNAPAFSALERKWNRQLTRPIFPAGAKNVVWERDYLGCTIV